MKWLLWLLLIGLGLLWISRSWRSAAAARRGAESPSSGMAPAAAAPRAVTSPDLMAACAHCGLHLPRRDALTDAQGQVFCSDTHRRAGPVSAPRGG